MTGVLLVQPNESLRRLYADQLSADGFPTEEVSFKCDAMGAARRQRPAVVVVDATLDPGEAAAFIRALRKDLDLAAVPVVGIAYLPGCVTPVLDAGATCCLRHLPSPDALVKAVRWATSVYHCDAA
jgi:DNA-binding response OmpR family regulator